MGTSIIRVKDETYIRLFNLKKPKESFDSVITTLLKSAEEAKLRINDQK